MGAVTGNKRLSPMSVMGGLSSRYGNWVLAPLSPAPSLFPIVATT